MNKRNPTLLAIISCFALTLSANAAPISKAEYKAGGDNISAKYKADKAACDVLAGNAKDICKEEASGHKMIAKAELEQSYEPSRRHEYKVSMAHAEANYAVAKEKCDDAAGNAKDVCRKEAKGAYVTAKADAKLAKKSSDANVSANAKIGDAKETASTTKMDAGKDAAAAKRDAAYATAKEKCGALAGDAKANCIKDAKALNGQL